MTARLTIAAARPGMERRCEYVPAYSMGCGKAASDGARFCPQHSGVTCESCGAPAVEECNYTGQFVCGTPLCRDCEGFNEEGKPGGAWGFMNHSHRRKERAGLIAQEPRTTFHLTPQQFQEMHNAG